MFRKIDCKTLGTKIRDRARREKSRQLASGGLSQQQKSSQNRSAIVGVGKPNRDKSAPKSPRQKNQQNQPKNHPHRHQRKQQQAKKFAQGAVRNAASNETAPKMPKSRQRMRKNEAGATESVKN